MNALPSLRPGTAKPMVQTACPRLSAQGVNAEPAQNHGSTSANRSQARTDRLTAQARAGENGGLARPGFPVSDMCLIAFAWRDHPRYRLALIANRDEFHARPTAPAGFHPEAGEVYGGRDLQAGGGWLMVSARGRLAAVTNVRVPDCPVAPRSRGALVLDFVRGASTPAACAEVLAAQAGQFAPFNLLLWAGDGLRFVGNHPGFSSWPVAPGRHAMTNGPMDQLWHKSSRAMRGLSDWLDGPRSHADQPDLSPLFAAMADREPAPDAALPDTGVGLERERFLSSPFIVSPDYGTRCSTVVLAGASDIVFAERCFDAEGAVIGESLHRLPLQD